jgi:hypothetical protein
MKRVIYNSDGTNIFKFKRPPMCPGDVHPYVDEVVGVGVTTFFICPNAGMNMYFPSQVANMLGTGLTEGQKQLFCDPNLQGVCQVAAGNLRALVGGGHDPIGLIVNRARRRRLETFITFRMNDIHDWPNSDSLLNSTFWLDHPDWRLGGDPGLNFEYREVRERRLAELVECCQRYDIDGIDLDFQRHPFYFQPGTGPVCVGIMNDFIREIRDAIDQVKGRRIALSARVPKSPQAAEAIGLNPAAWCNEKLVDFLTISLSFASVGNDEQLKSTPWRAVLSPDVPLYASIEVEPTLDKFRAAAHALVAENFNGLMLFNFFTWREPGGATVREPPFWLIEELVTLAGV